jgi:acetyl-CoA carboxylase/biotin carboxylase 1
MIGPTAEAMRAVGDKIGSSIIAQSLGIPTVPWSGSGVFIDTAKFRPLDETEYAKCHIHDLESGLSLCETIGFPIMIKASNGGGGKGIRIVHGKDDFSMAYNQVIVEVPNSPVFLMKVVQKARHIEVQILGDMASISTFEERLLD